MDSNHSAPAIVITVINDCASLWHEVLLGIEEEGIPFLLQHHPAGDIVDSARQAARSCAAAGRHCLRSTLAGRALQEFTRIGAAFTLMHHQDSQAQRNTGNNAARLVKGSPFGISMLNHRRTAV